MPFFVQKKGVGSSRCLVASLVTFLVSCPLFAGCIQPLIFVDTVVSRVIYSFWIAHPTIDCCLHGHYGSTILDNWMLAKVHVFGTEEYFLTHHNCCLMLPYLIAPPDFGWLPVHFRWWNAGVVCRSYSQIRCLSPPSEIIIPPKSLHPKNRTACGLLLEGGITLLPSPSPIFLVSYPKFCWYKKNQFWWLFPYH